MTQDSHKRVLKTSPTGVRFDIAKLAFIKGREGLETTQQVVNFLADEYYWRNREPGGFVPAVKFKEAKTTFKEVVKAIVPVIKVEPAILKLPGETSIDYAIRKAELK